MRGRTDPRSHGDGKGELRGWGPKGTARRSPAVAPYRFGSEALWRAEGVEQASPFLDSGQVKGYARYCQEPPKTSQLHLLDPTARWGPTLPGSALTP